MKMTVDIPDANYRETEVRAALTGQTVRAFVFDAVQEKLNRERGGSGEYVGWRSVYGKAAQGDVEAVQSVIDEEFSRIDAEGWK